MKIVILGCGKVGTKLAESLLSDKHDVTLIETDMEKCKLAAEELDTLVIHGNGTNTKTLEEAGIEDAQVFVAASAHDDTNLMASSIARDYKVPKIVSRLVDPKHETVFHEAGIDNLITPEKIVANHLKKIILD